MLEFQESDIDALREKSIDRFGVKSLGLTEIIRQYTSEEIRFYKFIENFKNELGRVSGELKVTNTELQLLFGKKNPYMSMISTTLGNPDSPRYNPDFTFSKEVLSSFSENLEALKYSFRNVLSIIKGYITLNPDMKENSRDRYTIKNPNFFSDVLHNPDASYWLGFLSADGYLIKSLYGIGTELQTRDEVHIKKFAELVGYDESRILHRVRLRTHGSEIKIQRSITVGFSCQPMYDTLISLGLFGSKSERKAVPPIIKEAIRLAKIDAKKVNTHWSETSYGKLAHAWLLGFYDGDGSKDKRSKYTALIYAASEDLLNDIKETFEIKNDVHPKVKKGEEVLTFGDWKISSGFYYLYLSPTVYKRMLQSYADILARKRP